jgi:CBS domain containing-hemolysin-like protein
MTLLFFYLFLALFVSFLCSVLEAVLLSITHSYIGSIDEPQKKERLVFLKSRLDHAISAILILNTIAHTMGAAGVGAEALKIFGAEWQTLIAVILTLLILYVSEIIPKTIGATYWRALAYPASLIILFLMRVLAPLIWISSQITKSIKKDKDEGPSRAEILAMADLGEQSGAIEEKEEQLIVNLLHLREVRVNDILTPRSVVYTLDAQATIESALEDDEIFNFSRIPVYSETSHNIVGQVFARKILAASLDTSKGMPIETIMTSVFTVSENLPVYYLLDQFIKRKEHLFVVRDEYEQYVGIVTLEDAIETLLGVEIVDEADEFVDMRQLARERSIRWKMQGSGDETQDGR